MTGDEPSLVLYGHIAQIICKQSIEGADSFVSAFLLHARTVATERAQVCWLLNGGYRLEVSLIVSCARVANEIPEPALLEAPRITVHAAILSDTESDSHSS